MSFYFDEQDWIPVPQDWSRNIIQGKTYDWSEETGLALYKQVQEKLRFQSMTLKMFVFDSEIRFYAFYEQKDKIEKILESFHGKDLMLVWGIQKLKQFRDVFKEYLS